MEMSPRPRLFFRAAFIAVFCTALGALAAPPSSGALDILPLFTDGETWGKKPNSFVMETRRYGFAFADSERDVAVSAAFGAMVFGGLPVFESRVYWKDGAMSRAEISIYNKGDAALPIMKEDFDAIVKKTAGLISGFLGKGISRNEEKPVAGKTVKSMKWDARSPMALLQWASEGSHLQDRRDDSFVAEYIRVVFVPKTGQGAVDNAALTGKGMLVKAKNLMALKGNVVKTQKGDVYIDGIPMVDQGRKGYCAASTAERLLRYYGLQFDQHQVAQFAETSARIGTSFEGITDAMEKIGKQFSLSQETLIKADSEGRNFDKSSTGEDIAEYNKAAKRMKKPQLDWHDFAIQVGPNTLSIDVNAIWSEMDPEVLLAAKTARKQQEAAFRRDIAKYVDAGVPLMWSCIVGIFPEVPDFGAQGAFGHVRLVIGYNKKTDEILYSDSWGGAHSLKRMPMDQAWAMTKGLMVLKPRN